MTKRIFDIFIALLAVVLLSPVMVLEALFIRMDSPGPVLFKQQRVGKDRKLFWIYKFRTMVEDAPKIGPVITPKEDPRVTQIGRVLRRLKLDELPQFFNVLKGEMSIVGPRPEVPGMVEKYPEYAAKIFSVPPGMIGPNQITNIDEENMMGEGQEQEPEKFYAENILPQKIKADLEYVQNRNPYKDLYFLLGGGTAVILNSLKLRYIFESRRRLVFLVLDLFLAAFSFWAAYALRFEGRIPEEETRVLFSLMPVLLILRASNFIGFGLYQTLWQYLGIQELISVIKSVTVGSLLLPLTSFFLRIHVPPRSVLIIDALFLIFLLGGSRILFKLTADRLRVTRLDKRKNVILIGADDAGEMLVREYIKRPSLGYRPTAFVDNHPDKIGMRIHGVKVIGKISQLGQVIRLKKADEAIITLSHGAPEEIKSIMQVCAQHKIPCRIAPSISPLLSPAVLPLKLRPVDVSDLLGREIVQGDQAGIREFVHGKRILVTGAGGSIGSELSRLLFQHSPKELILVDTSENNLYDIQMDLKEDNSQTRVYCYLRDVSKMDEMEKIFETHQPEIIYHAAAYKHVPLMESHYAKGVLNNVQGTRVMADLARGYNSEAFVLISTDKAINPSSVMGATKRIAELYVQGLAHQKTKTRFMSVRFGNVFNSKGSVVPLFKKQIEEGGPVTVTDPKMTRYFMDISEAVFLILQATILGTGSEIFILEMGKPVKILDLAKNLIQLAGLSPNAVEIKYTGLRPGEKMEEELELTGEKAVPTSHKKIKIWRAAGKPPANFADQIDDLLEMTASGASREAVLRKVQTLVPEYRPCNLT